MATNIVVPELGDSVIEATIIRWTKNEGDTVKIGETLVELETEKANFEVAADKNGVLSKIEKKENDDVEVGDVIGTIEESDKATDTSEKQKEKTGEQKKEQEKKESKQPEEEKVEELTAKKEKPEIEDKEDKKEHKEPEVGEDSGSRITPVAMELAKQNDIDISKIKGTGPSGRITKEDVEKFLESRQEKEQPAEQRDKEQKDKFDPSEFLPSLSKINAEREKRVKMSRRRRTIARRMLEAQQNAAILSTFNEIDMSAVMELRKRRKDAFKEKHGVSLGLSSFFVKATIGALKSFPELNAEIQEEEIVYKNYYDIGIAIGASEGLIVPVIREADRKSFAQIEYEVRDLAKRADEGGLTMDELMGGTFTITNGGVYGSMMSTPILNPPQVAILGMHKIEDRPVAVDGEVVIRPMMYVALSYDHRIVDGSEAVRFLVKIKELIEDPETLLIEG